MIILRIEKAGKDFILRGDNEEEIRITESVFVRHNLYKGKDLSQDEIREIHADSKRQEAIDIALSKLRNRKTEGEIRRLLSEREFADTTIDAAISYLETYGYVDDREYAILYCRDKKNINGYGPIKIAYLLRQKKVPDDCIDRALAEYSVEEEIEKIRALTEKRFVRGGSLKKEKPKIIRFFMNRGFHYDAIRKGMSEWT
ncbi:recombination regulator RecX [Aedoeadaptatus ivorii]|uniref:Regulatory protein RecX n=1 Tax=Aedoeadaptatus ivorii TaxID=54006 RepID=A0A3S5C2H2_9FIRM|nr:RecX family transcriptional regulator [Peptoniphilus ivorii]MDQ0507852.1 regulatory protein [Peptoniphilus ivorii]VEJ35679.1 recombination regulator RecX [Peptoniphilus ivorii]